MNTRIVIIRHGNTFKDGETPTRVGRNTDLLLVEYEKSIRAARYLKDQNIIPDAVFSSPLKRTMQTADKVLEEMHLNISIIPIDEFKEIDYGPDENQTEENVRYRLGKVYLEQEGHDITKIPDSEIIKRGKEVISEWDTNAAIPAGWQVEPADIIETWHKFAGNIEQHYKGKTILLFSSNGIIRFAPYLTNNFETFIGEHQLKVATGGISIFEKNDTQARWECTAWNIRP